MRFLYIREKGPVGTTKKGEKLRGKPIACIASVLNKETKTLSFGMSVCHPKDASSKKMFRKIALGRLQECPVVISGVEPGAKAITKKLMQSLADSSFQVPWTQNHKVPTQVKKAVEKWLSE